MNIDISVTFLSARRWGLKLIGVLSSILLSYYNPHHSWLSLTEQQNLTLFRGRAWMPEVERPEFRTDAKPKKRSLKGKCDSAFQNFCKILNFLQNLVLLLHHRPFPTVPPPTKIRNLINGRNLKRHIAARRQRNLSLYPPFLKANLPRPTGIIINKKH